MTEPAVGRFDVRVRQPGVQRKQRHLDGEGDEEGQEEQHLLEWAEDQAATRKLIQDGGVAEGAGAIVEINDRHQHQHRAGHGVEEELHRGVNAALVAPDADQEIHGDEADFPKHVKQKQVLGEENTHQAEFEQQQESEEFLDAALDVAPTDQHADGGEEGGEQHQPEADAIGGDVETDLRRCDPGQIDGELIAGERAVEPAEQGQRGDKGGERDRQRPVAARCRRGARQRHRDQESGGREQENEQEEVHRRPPAIMRTITSTPPSATQVA